MRTSSAAERDAEPMRNRGHETDSTSTAASEVLLTSPEEEATKTDGGRCTLLPPLIASSVLFSSLYSNCRRKTESLKELYTCHLCSFVGSIRPSFDQHMVDCHYIYRCAECSYSARTQGRLKRHLRDTHRKSTPFANHSAAPERPNSLRQVTGDHLKKTRRLKTIRCKYCKFITVEKIAFWRHLSDHIPPDKQLRCGRCPFVTDLKHHHEYHLRSHDGFKPFLCQKCGYSCVNKSMLNSHHKSHSNVYRFRCAVCSFAAKYSHALKLHIRKYGHSAGPILNQDGSLPIAVKAVPPAELPVLDRAGIQASETSEISVLQRHPFPVISAPVEGQIPVRSCNFSPPGIFVIHEDGETASVPVTLGLPERVVVLHDGKRYMPTSPGITLKTELTETANLSLEFANSKRTAGFPNAVTIADNCVTEEHQERDSLTEERKNVEEGPNLDLPLGAGFSSLTVPPFQFSPLDLRCASVTSDETTLDLSSLLQRQRRVHPLQLHLPVLSESQFYPQLVVSPGMITTPSAKARPFQSSDDFSTPTMNPESGFDQEQTFPLPGSETELCEFMSVDEARWDDEKPLDLTYTKGLKAKGGEARTPIFRNDLHVDEMTLILPPAPPSHQVFSPAAFSPSGITSPLSRHLDETALSYLPRESAGSCHSPPPLLPLSLTLHRSETRDSHRFQLIDSEEVLPVPTIQSPYLSREEERENQKQTPFSHLESSPVELETVEESFDGRTTDPSLEGRQFECGHCRMIFQDYVMFSIHSYHHGYPDPFECNKCGTKCEDRIQFFLHISRVAHE